MDLFTYLLGKKGKNSLVHKGNLFSYLLGIKNQGEVKTATGTTISISDVTREKIVSLTLSKESTQDGTPSPENPVEIKTVKGYRNLFDVTEFESQLVTGKILNDNGVEVNDVSSTYSKYMIPVKANTTYYRKGAWQRMYVYDTNKNLITRGSGVTGFDSSFTVEQDGYIGFQISNSYWSSNKGLEEIVEGNTLLPYVPYGTNWIYTKVSNGTDTNYYTIPLNGNEIAGIGDYKDELIIDRNGHCWLNKLINKVVLNGSETITIQKAKTNSTYFQFSSVTGISTPISKIPSAYSNYFSANTGNELSATDTQGFTFSANGYLRINILNSIASTVANFRAWLSTHNTEVCYPLETPQLIDLEYDVDIRLFNGVNNISNSDDMDMTLKYY